VFSLEAQNFNEISQQFFIFAKYTTNSIALLVPLRLLLLRERIISKEEKQRK
jgi:hypothetical protein